MKGEAASSKKLDMEKTTKDTKIKREKVKSLVTLLKKRLVMILIAMMKILFVFL